MSESLRDRVARVLAEHTIYAPMMSDFECACGFEADDNDAVEVTPNEHIADALIAAGLVAEPKPEPYVTCTLCGSTTGFHVGQCKARGRL